MLFLLYMSRQQRIHGLEITMPILLHIGANLYHHHHYITIGLGLADLPSIYRSPTPTTNTNPHHHSFPPPNQKTKNQNTKPIIHRLITHHQKPPLD